MNSQQSVRLQVRKAGDKKGKRYGSSLGSADEQLMQRLGDVIQGMKEDFIVVHLYHSCSFCRAYISADVRYARTHTLSDQDLLVCTRCLGHRDRFRHVVQFVRVV